MLEILFKGLLPREFIFYLFLPIVGIGWKEFEDEEILAGLDQCDGDKALGSNGFTFLVHHSCGRFGFLVSES